MTLLSDLFAAVAPVHALAVDATTLRVLCSDPLSPQLLQRSAVIVDFHWPGTAKVLAELDGAQRLLLSAAPAPTSGRLVASALSAGGIMSTWTDSGEQEQANMVTLEQGPLFLGQLTCALYTPTAVLVGGMSRQLYRAEFPGSTWKRLDDGLLDNSGTSESTAIYGLAQLNVRDLVAVGGDGEIWFQRDGLWRGLDSVTNLMLNDVSRIGEDIWLACGVSGTLLTVRADERLTWVEHDLGQTYLSAAVAFRGFAFVAGQNGIHRFRVEEGVRQDGAVSLSGGTNLLVVGNETIWAVGMTRIGRSEDGLTWDWVDAAGVQLQLPPPPA